MSDSHHIDDTVPAADFGLDDRSEELSERTEADAQVRFYRAMAATEADYGELLERLARAVAEVIYDLCVVYLVDEDSDELNCAAAFHPHGPTKEAIRQNFAPGNTGMAKGLIRRVIAQRTSYFRPRWRPSLLQAYHRGETPREALDIAIHSLMVVPLVSTDGDCLGALLVGRHNTVLSYDETDLALTEWIASHAAMKLETARLYRDLRQANQQLDAAVQARDTFISISSHELRTPLSTLKLHAQMLHRTACNKPERITAEAVRPKLESMDHQVDYLDRLVDQLLDVSRIIEGGLGVRWQPCDLGSVLREVMKRFAYEADQVGSTVHRQGLDSLVGTWDRERLDHIATNLLSNAIKYGQGNPIEVRLEQQGAQAILQVVDHGQGIPQEAQDRIFERFERAVDRRGQKGLGLGLWIVREYVESLEGSIEVVSELGEGSSFTIRLPLEPRGADQ